MALIFFPVKAEMLYFSNLEKGGQKGGHRMAYFTWSSRHKIENFQNLQSFQFKLGHSVAPLLAPLFQIRKV